MRRARHKFGAKPVKVDGFHYSSQLEARHGAHLTTLRDSGAVLGFLRQVPFHFPDGTRYVCDFLVFWEDGRCTFEECKGRETEQWKIKERLLAYHFPWVELSIIRK